MKTLKICAVFLLCVMLTGCTTREGYIDYDNAWPDIFALMDVNREAYTGDTVTIDLPESSCFTLVNAEGQSIMRSGGGLRGDLPLLDMEESVLLGKGSLFIVPYSNTFSFTINDAPREYFDEVSVKHGTRYCRVNSRGAEKISLKNFIQAELEGSEQIEATVDGYLLNTENTYLTITGKGSKQISVVFTETGAIAAGFTGDCNIRVFDQVAETTYQCQGGAMIIDVVNQPGEIIITPVADTRPGAPLDENAPTQITDEVMARNRRRRFDDTVYYSFACSVDNEPYENPTDHSCTITNQEGESVTDMYGNMKILYETTINYVYSHCVPYSQAFTYYSENTSMEETDYFYVSDEIFSYGAYGNGIRKIVVSDPGRVDVEGGNEFKVTIDGYLVENAKFKLWLRGSSSMSLSMQYTEKGVIATGLQGEWVLHWQECDADGHILTETDTVHTFSGEPVEIDLITQPGEVLYTPAK